MHECLYGPGELIYRKNEEQANIYFIIKGDVEIYIKKSDNLSLYDNNEEINDNQVIV